MPCQHRPFRPAVLTAVTGLGTAALAGIGPTPAAAAARIALATSGATSGAVTTAWRAQGVGGATPRLAAFYDRTGRPLPHRTGVRWQSRRPT